jgi:hypothetical protein
MPSTQNTFGINALREGLKHVRPATMASRRALQKLTQRPTKAPLTTISRDPGPARTAMPCLASSYTLAEQRANE